MEPKGILAGEGAASMFTGSKPVTGLFFSCVQLKSIAGHLNGNTKKASACHGTS
jgi:hypothetical protein